MMSFRYLTLVALLMVGMTAGFAKTEKTKKNPGAHDPFVMEKTAGKVYVFGVSQKLGGDEVYITEISEVDSLVPQKKTGGCAGGCEPDCEHLLQYKQEETGTDVGEGEKTLPGAW